MKISKLFHWLYAVLMFLPLVMFLPSCLYYSLNKYATNETTTQINYKYQSNEVNTLDDLVEGNIYFVQDLYFPINNSDEDFTLKIYACENWFYDGDWLLNDYDIYNYTNNDNNYITVDFSGQYENINLWLSNGKAYTQIGIDLSEYQFHFENVIFACTRGFDSFIEWLPFYMQNQDPYYPLPQYTDYNVIESVETNVQDTISNKMYQAWESIWNLPLFAWTKNSFVSAPFSYITGLFGLSSTNSLNYVFTYFCSISICWLVFDLLMYVPNLVHRWLDKGAIE